MFGPTIRDDGAQAMPSGLQAYYPGGQPDFDDEPEDVIQPATIDPIDSAVGILTAALLQDAANIDLINELQAFGARIKERLESQRDARVALLQSEANRLYEACRAALDKCRALQVEQQSAVMRVNVIAPDVISARATLRAIEARRPARGTYPTAEERQQWVNAVNDARLALSELEKKQVAAEQALEFVSRRLQTAESEFKQLHSEHQTIEARIAAGAPIETRLRPGERPPIGLQGGY